MIQYQLYYARDEPTATASLKVTSANVPALHGLDIFILHHLVVDAAFNALSRLVKIINNVDSIIYIDELGVQLYRSSSEHIYASIGDQTIIDTYLT